MRRFRTIGPRVWVWLWGVAPMKSGNLLGTQLLFHSRRPACILVASRARGTDMPAVLRLLSWLIFALFLLGVPLLGLSARAEERVVNVYNWTDYIDPAAIEAFQRETGILVRYDVYDS